MFSHRFDNTHAELNSKLRDGRSQALEKLCQDKLPNFGGGGKPFEWYERVLNIPINTKNTKNKQKDTTTTTSSKSPTSTAPTTTPTPTEGAPTTTMHTPINVPPSLSATPEIQEREPSILEYTRIDPNAFIQITKCITLDLDNLIEGVNLDKYVEEYIKVQQ
jgi:hypothetical protein